MQPGEATGEVESLWGKMDGRMGDRQVRARPKELEERLAKARRRRDADEKDGAKRRQKGAKAGRDADDPSWYVPKTRESKAAWEALLADIAMRLGAVDNATLMAAAGEVLATLKNESLRDPQRQSLLAGLVGPLPDADFAALVQHGKAISDFVPAADGGVGVDRMDDAMGVAVIFGEGSEDKSSSASGADELPVAGERNGDDGKHADSSDSSDGPRAARRSGRAGADGDDEAVDKDDIDPETIDARWLDQALAMHVADVSQLAALSTTVYAALAESASARECENRLVAALGVSQLQLIRKLLKNRYKIVFCMRLARADTQDERNAVVRELKATPEAAAVFKALFGAGKAAAGGAGLASVTARYAGGGGVGGGGGGGSGSGGVHAMDDGERGGGSSGKSYVDAATQGLRKMLDLETLEFAEGSHFQASKSFELPEGTYRTKGKGYEQVFIPALQEPALAANERIVSISELPAWTQPAFPNMTDLNRLQSRVYPVVFGSMVNMLICAPTGGGKTNVAMLAMLNEIGRHRDQFGAIDKSAFKIVYIAPMKSLVAEMVGSFSRRLAPLGIVVRELSGDVSMTKAQIAETQVIVSTPEKWDVLTRKSGDRLYTQLVRLLIIDEVHLLHDERGPVLEALVARTIRQVEQTQEQIRIVGLSATCPNYEDVATFLRVDLNNGLFHFDNSYRPCPLQQCYIGISEKKPLQRMAMMHELAYEKVAEQAGRNQMLLFVHSRKDTIKLAQFIRDKAIENDILHKLVMTDSASREILAEMAATAKSRELAALLPHGIGCHNAGMTRADRTLVEDLFGAGHLQIIVSTATLAWGVNLPAHTVIIVGTQVYSPEKGAWAELSYLDIMQMLGRAGRPGFDTFGEGVVITSASELQYYLALQNEQLSIESQLIKRLPDMLNAEIVLGTIHSIGEATDWLGYTYLYVRMLRAPRVYGVPLSAIDDDPLLTAFRADLVHTAAAALDRGALVKYDRRSGALASTDLGRVAAHFYIAHASMATYKDHLAPSMTDIEIFRLFALSAEFKHVVVRQEEKLELAKLLERVPIPVKEAVDEPTAKINVLLQAYISGLKLDGFALLADMVYVTQSAARIMRALFEIVLRLGWARLALDLLRTCKMIEHRMWSSQLPLRQFAGIDEDTLVKLEKKDYPWERYYDLSPQELGELVRTPKLGKQLYRLVHQFPRLDLAGHVQPVSRSLIKVELAITPDFQWDREAHGSSLAFHVLVEDVDSAVLLHAEYFVLYESGAEKEHVLDFYLELSEPVPPQYFVRLVSDRWLGCETLLPISFRYLLLPAREVGPIELLDLQPVDIGAAAGAAHKAWAAMWRAAGISSLNAVQTQTFASLVRSSDSVLVCAPAGSGKTLLAELAILRAWTKVEAALASGASEARLSVFYMAPLESLVDQRLADWLGRLAGATGPRLSIAQLTGDSATDLKLAASAELLLGTPGHFEQLTRRWRQRKPVQNVSLVIADELHLLGTRHGPTMEIVLSRLRFMAAELGSHVRMVGLSAPIADAVDVGEWLGCTSETIFAFGNTARPLPLEIHLQGFDAPAPAARQLAMRKPAYLAIERLAQAKPVIVWTANRKQARMTAIDFVTFAAADAAAAAAASGAAGGGATSRFLHASHADLAPYLGRITSPGLAETLAGGVGFLHESLTPLERNIVETLFRSGAIQVLVIDAALGWSLDLFAYLVIVLDTQAYSGRERRVTDYAVVDLLQLVGRAGRPGVDEHGHALVMTLSSRKKWLRKFLYEPLPIESYVDRYLADFISTEVAASTIGDLQGALDWLTWTLFYRRLTKNPNFYGLAGTSHRHLSDHLSELVETTVSELEKSRTLERLEDGVAVKPLNLGLVGAFYSISYRTIEILATSLTEKTKLRGLIEIVAAAAEFDELVSVGEDEASVLEALFDRLPAVAGKAAPSRPESFDDAAAKARTLLEAHFARMPLRADHEATLRRMLPVLLQLVGAAVDTIASSGWLKPALAACELSQMAVQAMWVTDSPLRQLPHLTAERVRAAQAAGVTNVFELLDNDEARDAILAGLDVRAVSDVARAANRFPSLDVRWQLAGADGVVAGDAVNVSVSLARELDEGETVGVVEAPFFPKPKPEGWWVIIGDATANRLYAIKKVTVAGAQTQAKLAFVAPEAGQHALKLFVLCDAYVGADQEYDLPLSVLADDEASGGSADDK